MQPLFEPVRSRVLETPGPSEDVSRPTLERIRQRGVLRVGFLPDRLPWSFRNSDGQLVGFDTEMAHVLARDLGVELEFVELPADELPRVLEEGAIDVGMSGIPITTALLESVNFSPPFMDETIAFIVRDYQREQYSSREAIQQISEPTIAVLDIPYYIEKVKRYLPTAKLVLIESPREFFRAPEGALDALLYTAESGSAWSLIYPSYTVAVPRPDILKVPLAYVVRRGDHEMADFLAGWIELKLRDASFDRLFNHWILGRVTAGRAPRWSILRDVLGWVD
jgi:ABC-type amino acid transport substrate-binding protein